MYVCLYIYMYIYVYITYTYIYAYTSTYPCIYPQQSRPTAYIGAFAILFLR